jgi:hypothetical protein
MVVALVVSLVAAITNPEPPRAEMSLALRSIQRLASIPTDMPGATEEERATRQPHKAELDALLIYLAKVQDVICIGSFNPAYTQNFLTVVMQTVAAGKQLAMTPEEALCWDRAGLDYANAIRRYVELQVHVGKLPPESLYQARAMYERVRNQYRKTLAGLVENAR